MSFQRMDRRRRWKILGFCLVVGSLAPWNCSVEKLNAGARPAAAQSPLPCTVLQIKISEVEADPVQSGTDTAFEWIELFNTLLECEMSGWTVTDGEDTDPLFTGMGGSNVVRIATMGHVIIAANRTNFLAHHPGFTGALIQIGDMSIGNGFNNDDDFLLLKDSSNTSVDCVAWGSDADNPCGFSVTPPTNNNNRTLQRNPTDGTDTDSASDWTNTSTETPSGIPTSVSLVSFTARSAKTRIIMRWETASEFDVVGFNVLRSINSVGPYVQINPTLIPAQNSGGVSGASYRYVDAEVVSGTTYHYLLETVSPDGRSQRFGPLVVQHRGSDVLESPETRP